MKIEPQNKRFIHCPDCNYLMCIVDITSKEKPFKYFRCSRCMSSSTIDQVAITAYPDATKDKPKTSIKKFRGYSRKFNKEGK